MVRDAVATADADGTVAELWDRAHRDGDKGSNGKRVLKWLTGNDIRDDVPDWAMTHNGKGCMTWHPGAVRWPAWGRKVDRRAVVRG